MSSVSLVNICHLIDKKDIEKNCVLVRALGIYSLNFHRYCAAVLVNYIYHVVYYTLSTYYYYY